MKFTIKIEERRKNVAFAIVGRADMKRVLRVLSEAGICARAPTEVSALLDELLDEEKAST